MQRSSYAIAGVQFQPGMRMNVRSHVRMPDAEAGTPDQRQQYFAEGAPVSISRQPLMIRRSLAVAVLVIAALVVMAILGVKMYTLYGLRNELSGNQQIFRETEAALAEMDLKVAEARSPVRISYAAEQEYHMISSSAVEPVPLTAPYTRYEQQNAYNSGSRENSPFSPSQGMIIGSR